MRRAAFWLFQGLLLFACSAGTGNLAAASSPDAPSEDCSYYAAPAREDGGTIPEGGAFGASASFRAGSFELPGVIANLFDKAGPGDTLCLRSGIYRGKNSMITPRRGFGGKPGKPITVRALVEGEVWIDGEHRNQTVGITGSHWVLQGFNAYNSSAGVIAVDGRAPPARDVTIRRVVAWRDPGRSEQNAMNVDVSFGDHVLLEDVACFGSARKCVQVHRSSHVTMRRVWARWDGRWPHVGGNQFAISPQYRSFDSLAENVLATSGGIDETGYTPNDYTTNVWLIGTDPVPTPEDVQRFAPGRDSHDVRMRLLGSIAYSAPGQRFDSHGVLITRAGMKGTVQQDLVVSVPASSQRVLINFECVPSEFGCRWKPGDLRNRATRLTLIGGPPKLKTKWKLNEFETRGIQKFDVQQPVDIFTPEASGASICHRYVDGLQTAEPLWPWPMNARILEATRRSGWGEADVTRDIEKLFGRIPAQCRSDR